MNIIDGIISAWDYESCRRHCICRTQKRYIMRLILSRSKKIRYKLCSGRLAVVRCALWCDMYDMDCCGAEIWLEWMTCRRTAASQSVTRRTIMGLTLTLQSSVSQSNLFWKLPSSDAWVRHIEGYMNKSINCSVFRAPNSSALILKSKWRWAVCKTFLEILKEHEKLNRKVYYLTKIFQKKIFLQFLQCDSLMYFTGKVRENSKL